MTNTAKHTPGPWKLDKRNGNFNKGIIDIRPLAPNCRDIVDANRLCATVNPKYSSGITVDEAKANARLIAAAPELLEALEFAREQMNPSVFQVKKIDAAIAKARGE